MGEEPAAGAPRHLPPPALHRAVNARDVRGTRDASGEPGSAVSVVDGRISMAENTVTGIDVAAGRPGPSFHPSGWLNSYTDRPAGVTMSPDGGTPYVTMPSGLERFRLS